MNILTTSRPLFKLKADSLLNTHTLNYVLYRHIQVYLKCPLPKRGGMMIGEAMSLVEILQFSLKTTNLKLLMYLVS